MSHRPEEAARRENDPIAAPYFVAWVPDANGHYVRDNIAISPQVRGSSDPTGLAGLVPGTIVAGVDGKLYVANTSGTPVALTSSAMAAFTGITSTTDAAGTGASGSSVTGITANDGLAGADPTTADPTNVTASTQAAGTGATGSATPAIDPIVVGRPENMGAPATKSTTAVHALHAASGANLFPGPITNPDRARNLRCTFEPAWDGGDITIVGTDQFGGGVTEVIADNPGNTVVGVKIFSTVTSITKEFVGASGDGCSVGTGDKLGLANALGYPVGSLSVAGLNEAGTWDTTYNAVTPTSAPDGAKNFSALYPASLTPTQASHTHTGPSHTHVVDVTDPTHSHTGPAHGHTVNIVDGGHTHTGPSHTHVVNVIDPGHVHV